MPGDAIGRLWDLIHLDHEGTPDALTIARAIVLHADRLDRLREEIAELKRQGDIIVDAATSFLKLTEKERK